MKLRLVFLALLAVFGLVQGGSLPGDSSFVTDPELGEPFQVRYFEAGEAGATEKYHATLVSYPWNHADPPRASVLYIHGFNDYFFQRSLAQKLDSAGYSFYAIDLHNYGRSYRAGERMGEVHDLSEYFPEIDSALAEIRARDNGPLILLGHSTGGLIATLYATNRGNGKDLSAIVLNSPFLEMNKNFLERKLFIPIVSALGKYFPNIDIPRGKNTNYGESLHKDYRGEWDYNLNLKVLSSLPVNTAWLRAIHVGHALVQGGLSVQTPILVMHSNCSIDEDEWVDEYSHCDGVLDVEQINEYGAGLGPKVTDVEIPDGLHDLFLSKESARDSAYSAMFQFLGKVIPQRP